MQDNFTASPNEQSNAYAQYFSVDQSDASKAEPPAMGYYRSHTDEFTKFRKTKQDQISVETTRLLLRLERLTGNDENAPKTSNVKERRSTYARDETDGTACAPFAYS